MKPYGNELILDIHDCDPETFTRESIEDFFRLLCGKINMDRGELFFWDYEDDPEEYAKAPPHLKGVSAVQFIMTSNMTIHTLDELKKVFLNVFSCGEFDTEGVISFAEDWFKGKMVQKWTVCRI